MYHVTGTGITIIILYIISYLFYRIGYFTLALHKRLWNSILAIAFLISALAGLFMALQISYKWNIPNIKSILKWHVEIGIGMAVTGIMHFLWHLSYFENILKREEHQEQKNNNPNSNSQGDSMIGINLFITGFVSSSIQILLIREMMNISGGYELIAGVFLGTWLITSAAGSSLAGKSNIMDLKKINLVFALTPLFSLLLLLLLARLFLETGETPSFLISLIYMFIVLIPFCLVSGFTFVRLISISRQRNGYVPGKSYSIETTGGITAGILISVLISENIGTYKLLLVIISLFAAYTLLTYFIVTVIGRMIGKVIFTLAISLIVLSEPDIIFRKILLPGIDIIESEDTPYGNITRGVYAGEESLYYNQRLLTYKDDVIEREEDIHYAMLQHDSPSKVILISGSLVSHLPEIKKYPVKSVVFIERDPALIKSFMADSIREEVLISNSDAFTYIRKTTGKADVIIMLVPPPSTLLLNRYYTTEFFFKIKERLNPGGVFMCSPGTADTYFNDESLSLNSSVFNSLKEVFPNVMPVVGNKLYFIASENIISSSFCRLTKLRGIINFYVSSDYLADDLTERKSNEISKLLGKKMRENSSSFPIAYRYFQSYHLSKNINEKAPALLLIIILFAAPLFTVKRRNLIMYFSASALAGFEIIVLLTLQLTAGNMYQFTGLIIAGLMTGLAIGSGAEIRWFSLISIRVKSLMLILFYALTACAYDPILNIKSSFLAISLIIMLSFLPAFITGSIFREFTREISNCDKYTASVYSADLSGSALGFIAVSGFVVPAIGTSATIYFLGLLVFAGFLFGTIMNKH
jgi:spermidine synthase